MARALDGVGDFYTQGAAVVTAYPFTFGCVFQTANNATALGFMGLDSGSGTHDWSLDTNSGPNVRFRCSDAGGAVGATSATSLVNNTWYSAIAVGTNATSRAAFVDGTAKATNATSRTPVGVANTRVGDTISVAELSGKICSAFILDIAAADADVALVTITAGSVYRSPLLVPAWQGHVVRYWPFKNLTTGNETDVIAQAVLTENGNPTNTEGPQIVEPPAVFYNHYRRR